MVHEIVLLATGMGLGIVFTIFTAFLIGLLYRLDCEHLYADEVDFEKPKAKLSLIAKKGG